MFSGSGCLLVAAKPYKPAATRRAKKENWTEEQLRADSWERLGGRIRGAYTTGRHLALAAGGPEVSDGELLEAVSELREFARRLAPDIGYAFITFPEPFRLLSAPSLHIQWSPEAPQACPVEISDEIVFDAFPAQILGPGHIRRLGGIPAGAALLDGGRVELVIGEQRSWLPTLRQRGRALLARCLVESRGEAERIAHQRYEAALASLTAEELASMSRFLWRLGFKGPIEQVVADPAMFGMVRAALSRPVQSDARLGGEPDFIIRSRQHDLPVGQLQNQLNKLHRPVRLHLYPAPPTTLGVSTQLSQEALERAGEWVVAGKPVEIWGMIQYSRFPLLIEEASKFLPYCSTLALSQSSSRDPWLVGFHEGGQVRMAIGSPVGDARPTVLVAGRLPGHALPVGSQAAEVDQLQRAGDLIDLARYVSPDIGYGCMAINGGNLSSLGPADVIQLLCDELVFDAFPYQVLGPRHIARLGGVPEGGGPIADGKIELSIGQLIDWLPRMQDAGRKLLSPCLVTAQEASAMVRTRRGE